MVDISAGLLKPDFRPDHRLWACPQSSPNSYSKPKANPKAGSSSSIARRNRRNTLEGRLGVPVHQAVWSRVRKEDGIVKQDEHL